MKIEQIGRGSQRAGKSICAAVAVSLAALALQAGIEITTDHADALYTCGEQAVFTVKVTDGAALMKTGSVSVVLDNFGPTVLSRQTYSLAETNAIVVAGARNDPGFLRLTVCGAGGQATWGVGYEPDRIAPATPVPDDFDAFWSDARQKLAREVPLDAQVTKVPERCTAAFDYYRISFATFGRRVHGYMSVPTDKSKAPFPVHLQVAAAGFGGWTNDMGGSPDRISVFFGVYPFEPNWKWNELGLKSLYDKMNDEARAKYPCGGYATAGAGNSREEYFFYPVILGIDRAIDWVAARPDVDAKRIVYSGTSQGGGMGLILTGLNKHITRAAFFVPAITDTLAGQAGRQSGWPQPVENQRTDAAKATAAKVMPYFDGASFATRITCPVRFAIGMADTTCAPHCTWAAYNAVASKDKRLFYGIGMGHGCRGEFYSALGTWLRGTEGREPLVATITIDDNNKDWMTIVKPLLEKYGRKAIFNVVAKHFPKEKNDRYLSWDDVRALRDAGHEIANHSLTHANMGFLLRDGKTNEVVREIYESRDIFVRELGKIDWFCYAGNWGDAFCHRTVNEAGMRSLAQRRPNFGYLTPPWTDKGVYVMLMNAANKGERNVELMIHGFRRKHGWLPFESAEQFEEFLKELKALEEEGFIRVLPYSEAHPMCGAVRTVTDPETGGLGAITIADDETGMNWTQSGKDKELPWVTSSYRWGTGTVKVDGRMVGWNKPVRGEGGVTVYRPAEGLEVRVRRQAKDGGLEETYEWRNVSGKPMSLSEIDVHTPFRDDYLPRNEMWTRRCFAHVWAGGSSAWVCAMRMGGKAPHLGLAVTEGAVDAYELKLRGHKTGTSNYRGVIALSPTDVTLAPGASASVSWRLFAFADKADFFRRVRELGGVSVTASDWTVTRKEPVDVTFEWKGGKETKHVAFEREGRIVVPFEYGNGKRTFAELNAIADPFEHVLRRARFLVAHQQVNDPTSPYDGAFTQYDMETGRQRRWWEVGGGPDMEPGAERMGIGVSLAALAQLGYEDEFLPPLRRYAAFVMKLCRPDNYVYASLSPNSRRRDFNSPWAAEFFLEMYKLTGEKPYLQKAYELLLSVVLRKGTLIQVESPDAELVKTLRKAGMKEEAEKLVAALVAHKDLSLKVAKTNERVEEVSFAPEYATSRILQFLAAYDFVGDRRYLQDALDFVPVFEANLSPQPSAWCHDIGLHHWDGLWFGKRGFWGDTLPNHWNGSGADTFAELARHGVSPEESRRRARAIARQVLTLIRPDGGAGCAFIYPDRVNGRPAKFLDPLANDQDWVMLYYLRRGCPETRSAVSAE